MMRRHSRPNQSVKCVCVCVWYTIFNHMLCRVIICVFFIKIFDKENRRQRNRRKKKKTNILDFFATNCVRNQFGNEKTKTKTTTKKMEQIANTSNDRPSSQPPSNALMYHPDVVRIRERFKQRMSKMQKEAATSIQDMFSFFADEMSSVTAKALSMQQPKQQLDSAGADLRQIEQTNNHNDNNDNSDGEIDHDISQKVVPTRQEKRSRTPSYNTRASKRVSAEMVTPKEEPDLEEIPLSVKMEIDLNK